MKQLLWANAAYHLKNRHKQKSLLYGYVMNLLYCLNVVNICMNCTENMPIAMPMLFAAYVRSVSRILIMYCLWTQLQTQSRAGLFLTMYKTLEACF